MPEFVGTATTRPTPEQREWLIAFVAPDQQRGRALQELAELTDRTQTVLCTLSRAKLSRRRLSHATKASGSAR